ncbi:MAG: glutamate 5-kinase [Rhodospirillaceae bacterium TMED8]|nr:glutamate 5-kinase [Magnetovibrio sp.]MAH84998.1 glutamate 5-kinase [Magnetovibrio sp.]OUT49289.1 MAG: glutamate 5-kinase [Rhodospirillaceae bacterium TMED8]OUT50539.1 MAG: glutamate 5-kinase [Rhodospirillaceae bacterium TMED8]|tara:strand:- start:3783 stop:4907 length:1125 start_codon:yes stop_codon:yes gene_type:complete
MGVKKPFESSKRVVIKIGSSLLVDPEQGSVHRKWLEALADDIAQCRANGQQVVIVSSGAIAVGRRHLGLRDGKLKLEESQAAAATGMIRLAHAYQDVLAHHNLTVAQVLVTLDDSESRRRYLNARNTLETLLRLGAVPLINENDTVATDEIRFGDNDRLAARVSAMISADTLVLLSNIDGLYDRDPRYETDAKLVPEVRGAISQYVQDMAGSSISCDGSGGMVTKFEAARIAMGAGARMVITNGLHSHPLRRLTKGSACTWFLPDANPRTARKRWIAGVLKPAGEIIVDEGAVNALKSGKSILPAGVLDIIGQFDRGDAVIVRARDGLEVGRGIIAYSSDDAQRIKGNKTSEIEALLGYRGRDEIVHRDDFALE